MRIQTIVCGAYEENAYLALPDASDEAFLVDPGDDLPALKDAVARSGRKLSHVLLTHGHFDHALSADALRRDAGCSVMIGEKDARMLGDKAYSQYNPAAAEAPFMPFAADAFYPADGAVMDVCGVRLRVIHTPGHTPGGVCLYAEEEKTLFSGDTLFAHGFGRTDMAGGSMEQLLLSLRKLFLLPEDTRVLPGHMEEALMRDILEAYR
jgi:hydroxyacylglutathione hydrolase